MTTTETKIAMGVELTGEDILVLEAQYKRFFEKWCSTLMSSEEYRCSIVGDIDLEESVSLADVFLFYRRVATVLGCPTVHFTQFRQVLITGVCDNLVLYRPDLAMRDWLVSESEGLIGKSDANFVVRIFALLSEFTLGQVTSELSGNLREFCDRFFREMAGYPINLANRTRVFWSLELLKEEHMKAKALKMRGAAWFKSVEELKAAGSGRLAT